MISEEDIRRINELFHKSKGEGLTAEETIEQQELRGRYIMSFRENLRVQLENIDIQNPDGSITHVADRRKKKRKQ